MGDTQAPDEDIQHLQWLPKHEQAFVAIKAALLKALVLAFFDPMLPTILPTDT